MPRTRRPRNDGGEKGKGRREGDEYVWIVGVTTGRWAERKREKELARSLADLLVEIRHFGSGIRSVVDTEVVELSAPETRGGGG